MIRAYINATTKAVTRAVMPGSVLNLTAEYKAVLYSFTAKPDESLKTAQNTFVKSLLDAGIWAKLDRLFVFNIHTNAAHEALIDWIHPTGTPAELTFGTGGAVPSFINYIGFEGNIANKSLINTKFNQLSSSVKYTQNAASFGVYLHKLATAGMVLSLNGDYKTSLQETASRYCINNKADDFTNRNFSTKKGLLSVVRKDANTAFIVFGATKSAEITSESGVLQNKEFYLLGGYSTYYSDTQIGLAYMGGYLTDTEIGVINSAYENYLEYTDNGFYSENDVVGVLGDSTMDNVSAFMATQSLLIDISHGGDTISVQKDKWNLQPLKRTQSDIIFVMVGLNDVVANANIVSDYQNLINTIRADIGTTKKIVALTMIPCSRSNKAGWTDLNNAILGLSETNITGLDSTINTVNTALNAGDNTLAALYDSGDGLHENDLGRQLIADLIDAKVIELGVFV